MPRVYEAKKTVDWVWLVAFEKSTSATSKRRVRISREMYDYLLTNCSYYGEVGTVSIFKFPATDFDSRTSTRKFDYGSSNLLSLHLNTVFPGTRTPDYKVLWISHAIWADRRPLKCRTNVNPNRDNTFNPDKHGTIVTPRRRTKKKEVV